MYRTEIFLEIRLTIPSYAKAFCACKPGGVAAGCEFCRGEARSVPQVNAAATEFAYTLADELDCELLAESAFEKRKNLPPVPPKYRVSGLSLKTAGNGFMEIQFHRRKKRVRITEVRVEEYAGYPVYAPGRPAENGDTPVVSDYSRAGCPCILIRTAADFETGDEADIFISELGRRIQYVGLLRVLRPSGIDSSYEPIRCNAYVGVAEGTDGQPCFVKLRNLGSLDFLKKAIDTEIHRQEEILSAGGSVQPESFIWNPDEESTVFYRAHDEAFPFDVSTEPSSVPVPFRCPPALLTGLRARVSEHPSECRERFVKNFELPWRLADFISAEKDRADFLDQCVAALGAPPLPAARIVMSDVVPLLRKHGMEIRNSPLSPKRFAEVLRLYGAGGLSVKHLKLLLAKIVETDGDPETLVDENGWRQFCDTKALTEAAKAVLAENPAYAEKLKACDLSALAFLTERIAEKTGNSADRDLIQRILRDEAGISVCHILSMGGTISGFVPETPENACLSPGEVQSGGAGVLSLLAGKDAPGANLVVESVVAENLMSEEIQPSDWASLISCVATKLAGGNVNGIVIAHGTDTLAFTAPLIYWLFGDTPVPIVLTASSTPPVCPPAQENAAGTASDADEPCEAAANLRTAVSLARGRERGVYVVFGGRVLSPFNLKFISPSSSGFCNWNLGKPVFRGQGLLSDYGNADPYVMGRILSDAADRMHLCRIFPGLRSDRLLALIDAGVTDFFLETYGRGTGNMKDSSYSLKELLMKGKQKGCRFYCTSQQECEVNFFGYASSRRLWREGLIPMGGLTTETAVALYFAASLVCDSPEELLLTMETVAACL